MVNHVEDRDRHRIVGTCMIWRVREDGKIVHFIHKRRPDLTQYPNLWTVVGGGMDRADYEELPKTSPDGWEAPLEIAMRKEVAQEAGVEVLTFFYLSNFTFIRRDGVPVFGVRFHARYFSGEVKIDPEESTEFAWITADEVKNYEFLGNVANEILSLDAHLRSKTIPEV